jgi:hypothetical protein
MTEFPPVTVRLLRALRIGERRMVRGALVSVPADQAAELLQCGAAVVEAADLPTVRHAHAARLAAQRPA